MYGPAGSDWTPIAGDWNGNDVDTVGLYNATTSTFYLRNTNTTGVANDTFVFTSVDGGKTPIVGDWNGNGVDTIGLYSSATSAFSLRNTNGPGAADLRFGFGQAAAGLKPIAGDWDGDGVDTVGVYNPGVSVFSLKDSLGDGFTDATFHYGPAGALWTPIIGDWNGSAAALTAAGGEVTPAADAVSITTSTLQPLMSEAIARWAATELSTDSLSALASVKFAVADLPGATLGLADGNTIFIDMDAAGHGWFVDSTPWQDEEFSGQQAIDPRAVDDIDLLTVVEHELGHILGLADLDASLDDLMSETLSSGIRRSATAEVFAAVGE